MPWKECHVVDERLRFVARLLDGEKMAVLCRDFGISRKTGYKIYDRYKDCGVHGLTDRARRPYRQANQLPVQVETALVALKREYPDWGAAKIRDRLRRQYPDLRCPAISTVHAVLDRHGLVVHRRPRRYRATGTTLSHPTQPNELWCADYKGEFMLANRRYCYPLTITDFASRYLLTCEALSTTQETYAITVFERVFSEFGLPRAIRTDNGIPFSVRTRSTGSANCRCGGCGSASRSNGSNPGIRSRTAGTSACISRSRRKPRSPHQAMCSSSRPGSTPSSSGTTTNDRIRRSTCRRPGNSSAHLHGAIADYRRSPIRVTTGPRR
jgi:transposase